MMVSQEISFILLLICLQGTENNVVNPSPGSIITVTNTTNSNSSLSTLKTEQTGTTGRTPTLSVTSSTVIKEVTISGTAVDNIQNNSVTTASYFGTTLKTTHQSVFSTKDVNHSSTSNIQNNSVTTASYFGTTLKTTHQSVFSTKDVNHSSTSNSTMSPTLSIPTTISSDLLTVSKSYVTTPSIPVNFTTTTYAVNITTMVSTNRTQISFKTVPPTNILPNVSTMLWSTMNTTTTTDLRISTQTPRPHSNFTDSSAEAREPQKEHHNNGGVVFGAIVGAVLGCALISLVGYFLCGKRKSDSFGHQRLYDDTRNDPVLRLDNAPEPYGANFGDLSFFSTPTANETAAHDAIPMDDMTLSRLSP